MLGLALKPLIDAIDSHHEAKLSDYFQQVIQCRLQWQSINRYRLSNLTSLLGCCLLYCLAVLSFHHSCHSTFFYLDGIQVYHLNRIIYVILAAMALQTIYFRELIYFHKDVSVMRPIAHIILQGRCDDFLPPYKYQTRHVLTYIRWYSIFYWSLMVFLRFVSGTL